MACLVRWLELKGISDVKVVGLVVDWMELAGVLLLAGATSGKLVLEVDRG